MSGGLWGDGGIDVVRTLRKDELDRVTIGQCRRLQEHVFNPDPEWNGSVDTEQFIPKPVEALTSGADLEAEIDFVRQREPASSERWHIVRENGTVIAKAHTHTRQLRALVSVATEGGERVEVCFTVLALTGVNVSPNARGRGLGQLVTQAAFAQLSRVPQEAPKENPPVCCLFQTGSAQPFYLKLGCRVVGKAEIVQLTEVGHTGNAPLAFTDKFVMIYPGTCAWPPGAAAPDDGSTSLGTAVEKITSWSIIDACGYTGSWAWWREPAPGRPPPPRSQANL